MKDSENGSIIATEGCQLWYLKQWSLKYSNVFISASYILRWALLSIRTSLNNMRVTGENNNMLNTNELRLCILNYL